MDEIGESSIKSYTSVDRKSSKQKRKTSLESVSDTIADAQLKAQLYSHKFSLLFEIIYPTEETKEKRWYKVFEEICLSSSMPKTQKYLVKKGMKDRKLSHYILLMIDVILRGVAQVFLCNHPLCGVLVLIGLGFTSLELPLYALLGTALSTFSAVAVARPPEADILAGLCGYDGALVGCACLTFFGGFRETITATILLSFLAGIVHVAVTNLMKIWQLPSFTFAFNIVTIMIIFAVNGDNVKLRFAKSTPIQHSPNWTDMSFMFAVDASIRGVGQFMFADTTIGSSFVVAGIALCSRKGAAIALLGSIIGWIVAYYVLDTTNRINIRSGLYGYNCAGTCCVLAGGIFYPASDGAILVGICGAALAALLHQGIGGAFGGLPVLTFPFIISAWILMLCRSKWLEITSDGILRPLLRKMSSARMPSFSITEKPHPVSRNNSSNMDPISRLRSRLNFTTSGKMKRESSSKKVASSGKHTALEVYKEDDIEEGSADEITSIRDEEIDRDENTLFMMKDSGELTAPKKEKSPKTPISFKNMAKNLVEIQREIKIEKQIHERLAKEEEENADDDDDEVEEIQLKQSPRKFRFDDVGDVY